MPHGLREAIWAIMRVFHTILLISVVNLTSASKAPTQSSILLCCAEYLNPAPSVVLKIATSLPGYCGGKASVCAGAFLCLIAAEAWHGVIAKHIGLARV